MEKDYIRIQKGKPGFTMSKYIQGRIFLTLSEPTNDDDDDGREKQISLMSQ